MRAHTNPLIISSFGAPEQSTQALERVPLSKSERAGLYDERWLQTLIQDNPALLPVTDIEAGIAAPVPICIELPLRSGFADNLLMTPEGGIVVVETKLWRNPEARREVIAQILDYAKDLSRMSYSDLEAVVRIARNNPSAKLFQLVAESSGEDEATFVDAVSSNLRQGRMLLIIAGEGIQESAEELADFVQSHMTLHFTLSMVEMAMWRLPGDARILVQPRILMRTLQITRTLLRVEGGVATTTEMTPKTPERQRATTFSEEEFLETLASVESTLPGKVAAFVESLEPLGVYTTVGGALSLRWDSPNGLSFHLGSIDRKGVLQTDYANWRPNAIGRLDLAHDYQRAVAGLLPGGMVKQTPTPESWHVGLAPKGKYPPASFALDRADAWRQIIADYIKRLSQALEQSEG